MDHDQDSADHRGHLLTLPGDAVVGAGRIVG